MSAAAKEHVSRKRAAATPVRAREGRRQAANLEAFFAGSVKGGKVAQFSLPADMVKAAYRSDPKIRIHIIKHGTSPKFFTVLANAMQYSKEELGKTLGLSITTVDRKAKAGENLSPEQSERLVGMVKLIGQVQAMVEESGDPVDFNAAQWVAHWLEAPSPALGGQRPAEFMDTAEGRDFVSRLLSMAQSGAYA